VGGPGRQGSPVPGKSFRLTVFLSSPAAGHHGDRFGQGRSGCFTDSYR
jgi:hypothetical protein